MSEPQIPKGPILGAEGVLALLLVAALPATQSSAFTRALLLPEVVLGVIGSAVLLLWGLQFARRRVERIRGAGVILTLWALVAVSVVSGFSVGWQNDTVLALSRWIALAAVATAVVAPSGRRISLRAIALAVSSGLLVAGCIEVYELFRAHNEDVLQTFFVSQPWLLFDRATYAALAAPLCVTTALRYSGTARWVSAIGALCAAMLIGLASTWEIDVALLVGTSLVVVLFLVWRRPMGTLTRVGLGFVVVGALIVVASFVRTPEQAPVPRGPASQQASAKLEQHREFIDPTEGLVAQVAEIPQGTGAQEFLVNSGLAALADRPIFGVGVGGADEALETYPSHSSPYMKALRGVVPRFKGFHSGMLNLGVELGLVGLAFLLAFLGIVVAQTIRTIGASPKDDLDLEYSHWGISASFAVGLVLFILTPLESLPSGFALFGIVIGGQIALAHSNLGDRFMLRELDLTQAGAQRVGLLVGISLLVAAFAVSFSLVQFTTANYYKQWGNLHYARSAPEHRKAAIERYEQALHYAPKDSESLAMLGYLHLNANQPFDARDRFDEALALRPNNVSYLLGRASAEQSARRYEQAVLELQKILDLQPNLIEAQLRLAQVVRAQGDSLRALILLKAALELQPPTEWEAEIHKELADTHLRDGRLPLAERELNEAARLAGPKGMYLGLTNLYERLDYAKERAKKAESGEKRGAPTAPVDEHEH
ncbi:MAG: hypothetical protein AUK47_26925 [Deltaproteobacteria bacterium CG2_30_63_29]|nr:MAG: hypothetical protein AUK47_26925 [Deltaproteobacteria bacterium CG2_30_63_29]